MGQTQVPGSTGENRWAYGVTTVPQRFHRELLNTLRSLWSAGFPRPALYVDEQLQVPSFIADQCAYVCTQPKLLTAGRWFTALADLYIRNPSKDFYALFQDDVELCANVRQYIESFCDFPERGYLNLYTVPANEVLANGKTGWFFSNQHGKGALALVFSRLGVLTLLSSRKLLERFADEQRGWQAIDGGVVEAMKAARWYEWCHFPSLVQHTGADTTMGTLQRPRSASFRRSDALQFASPPRQLSPPAFVLESESAADRSPHG